MKKIVTFFLSFALIFSLSAPILAIDDPSSVTHNTPTLKDVSTSELLEQFEAVSGQISYSDEVSISYISEISERSKEFSDEDLISKIADNSGSANYRRGLLETYLTKYDFVISDNKFLDMVEDPNFDIGMKILIIVCLSDDILASKEAKDMLVSLSSSEEGELAYHAIKALADVDLQKALRISEEILENIDTELEEKINIALNLIAENLQYTNTAVFKTSKNDSYVSYLYDVYQKTESTEVQVAVKSALSQISTKEATVALEQIRASAAQMRVDGVGGYAAYRDGVQIIGNVITNWHAGIAVSGVGTSAQFAQATGKNYTTDIVSYSSFVNGNTFLGYYQPASVSYYHPYRDAVVETAEIVANLHIPYVAVTCITYDYIPMTQTHYNPSDIQAIRCDGFVEYCFEYEGIRLAGPDNYWDITLRDTSAQDVHYGVAAITPKKQAEDYMVLVNLN